MSVASTASELSDLSLVVVCQPTGSLKPADLVHGLR